VLVQSGGWRHESSRSRDLEIWLNHFEHHALRPRRVPHGLADVLTPDESHLIASSIATFQLGEQADGRTLLRAAERFARTNEMPHLVRIVDLLIREERRHASLLRAFMQDHRLSLQRSHWTDRVFRRIRRLAGLELYSPFLSAPSSSGPSITAPLNRSRSAGACRFSAALWLPMSSPMSASSRSCCRPCEPAAALRRGP
jgi:hypothetical protein